MKKKEYINYSDDLKLLEELKAEQNENLKKCLSQITKRRNRHIFTYSSAIAAAAILASFLIWNPLSEVPKQRVETSLNVQVPTLFFETGQTIPLTSQQSELKQIALSNGNPSTSNRGGKVGVNRIVIPPCYTHTIVLEDGTEVTLNANSELRYPSSFNQGTREVYFQGEAYFKVAKSDKQFIIHTSDLSIAVYGTQFNVNSHKSNNIETLLVEGVIGISSPKRGLKEVKMTSQQLFQFNSTDGKNSLTTVNSGDYLGWLDGNFICSSAPLSKLLNDISAWYGVRFNNNEIANKKIINVNISRNLTIEQLLETLQEMSNIEFIKEGRDIYSIR